MSDVVEVLDSKKPENEFYYCNTYGFYKVDFDPSATKKSELFLKTEPPNRITVLLVEPNKYPKFIEVEDTLRAMQETVGGDIEEYMPFEDEVAIICHEEGKINGEPLNRAIYSEAPSEEMPWEKLKERFHQHETERFKAIREVRQQYGLEALYGAEALKIVPPPLNGYVVFSQDSFKEPYSAESRTYEFNSDNKAINCSAGGYSIYASSLDGSDKNVRIDLYMKDERGGADGWKIEKCYLRDDRKREMLDIVAGKFFLYYAPVESEKFQNLPKDLAQKYERMFKYPETFSRTQNGIQATPFKPKSKEMER